MNEQQRLQLMIDMLRLVDAHNFKGEIFLTSKTFNSKYPQNEINLIANSLISSGYMRGAKNEGNGLKFFLASSLTPKGQSFLKKLE